MADQMQTKRFMTIRESSRLRDFPPEWVLRQMCKTGKLHGFYSGSRFYVDVDRTREMLETLSNENGSI